MRILRDLRYRIKDINKLFNILQSEVIRVQNAEEDILYQAAMLAGMSTLDLYRVAKPAPVPMRKEELYDDITSDDEQQEEPVAAELGVEQQEELEDMQQEELGVEQ